MSLVRERRQQRALRLILPPPPGLSNRALSPSSLSSASSSSSSSSSNSPTTLADLKKLSILGRGNGGTVYKVSDKLTSAIYAFKVVRPVDEDVASDAVREAEILQKVDSSQYVVRCMGVFYGGSPDLESRGVELCLVMEYMDAGSLHDILSKKKTLPEQVISEIVRSVLKGLQYLHGLHVVHRDIKPSNLLLNMRGEVKIADFGASRVVTDGGGEHTAAMMGLDDHVMGTCAYMSPERMDPQRWDGEWCDGYAGDVWSLGVVAMECYMGRFPLVGPDQNLDWVTLMCAVCMGENVDKVVKLASPEFVSFCRRCLEREWRKRGTVEELLHHPFVNGNGNGNGNGVEDVVSYVASND